MSQSTSDKLARILLRLQQSPWSLDQRRIEQTFGPNLSERLLRALHDFASSLGSRITFGQAVLLIRQQQQQRIQSTRNNPAAHNIFLPKDVDRARDGAIQLQVGTATNKQAAKARNSTQPPPKGPTPPADQPEDFTTDPHAVRSLTRSNSATSVDSALDLTARHPSHRSKAPDESQRRGEDSGTHWSRGLQESGPGEQGRSAVEPQGANEVESEVESEVEREVEGGDEQESEEEIAPQIVAELELEHEPGTVDNLSLLDLEPTGQEFDLGAQIRDQKYSQVGRGPARKGMNCPNGIDNGSPHTLLPTSNGRLATMSQEKKRRRTSSILPSSFAALASSTDGQEVASQLDLAKIRLGKAQELVRQTTETLALRKKNWHDKCDMLKNCTDHAAACRLMVGKLAEAIRDHDGRFGEVFPAARAPLTEERIKQEGLATKYEEDAKELQGEVDVLSSLLVTDEKELVLLKADCKIKQRKCGEVAELRKDDIEKQMRILEAEWQEVLQIVRDMQAESDIEE